MPDLVKGGATIATFPTRAECIVEAFRLKLVYDYGRRRNSFLPGVKVVGEDDDRVVEVVTPGRRMREA